MDEKERRRRLAKAYIKASTPEEVSLDMVEGMSELTGRMEGLESLVKGSSERLEGISKGLQSTIRSLMPSVQHGKTPTPEELESLITPLIPDPIPGSPDSAQEVRDKLMSLEGDERLSVLNLRDLEWLRAGEGERMNWSSAGFKVFTDATLTGDGSAAKPLHVASSGGVTTVSNADGSLTITPTSGAVVASLTVSHGNDWTALQTFGAGVVIGGLALLSFNTLASPLQIQGTTHANGSFTMAMFATSTLSEFNFYRSRNVTIGQATAVALNDDLGRFNWYGASSGTFSQQGQAASIRAVVDGGVFANSVPGRLELGTTSSGGTFATTKVTINSFGGVGFLGSFGSTGQGLRSNGTLFPTWANFGTVTSVSTDSTLLGGPITLSGTLGLNLGNPNFWTATQTFGPSGGFPAAMFYQSGSANIWESYDNLGDPQTYLSAAGWLVDVPGRRVTSNDYTDNAGVMTPLTDLSVELVKGRRYSGEIYLTVDNTLASGGIDIDLNGGTSAFAILSFGVTAVPYGAIVGSDWSGLPGTALRITALPDTERHIVKVSFTLSTVGGGTLIPQISEDSGGGTVRANKGLCWIDIIDMN